MAVTNETLLAEVNQAIMDIVSGRVSQKSVIIGGGTTSAMSLDLDGLRRLKKDLQAEILESENSGCFERAVFGSARI